MKLVELLYEHRPRLSSMAPLKEATPQLNSVCLSPPLSLFPREGKGTPGMRRSIAHFDADFRGRICRQSGVSRRQKGDRDRELVVVDEGVLALELLELNVDDPLPLQLQSIISLFSTAARSLEKSLASVQVHALDCLLARSLAWQ